MSRAVEVVIDAGVLGAVSDGAVDSGASGMVGLRGVVAGIVSGAVVDRASTTGLVTAEAKACWKYGSEAVANLPDHLLVRLKIGI